MSLIILVVVSVLFAELFVRANIPVQVIAITRLSHEAIAVLSSQSASDEEKERFVRHQSLRLTRETGYFVAKFALVGLALYLLLELGVMLFGIPLEQLFAQMLSPAAVIAVSAAALGYLKVRRVFFPRL